ncbi:MAG: hypothetical protein SWO11_05665 [Thermodesulfobacteriota bacterium]|nr:hypothetical protein [Thermodesulfobacteriota bacterium]
MKCLNILEYISNNKFKKLKNYKQKLVWAFETVEGSNYGPKSMQARIPDPCLHVDHARRIRNLWGHNNGLINENYKSDCIQVPDKSAIVDDTYLEYKKTKRKIPIALNSKGFINICSSHIEFLHQLHYNI